MSQMATASARRLELYTELSVYGVLALQPLIYLGAFPSWGPAVGFGVGVIQTVVSILVCHRAFRALRQGATRPSRREWLLLGVWLAFSALVLVVLVAQLRPDQPWMPVVLAAVAVPAGAVALLLSGRTGLIVGVALGTVIGSVVALRMHESGPVLVTLAIISGGTVAFVVLTFWLTGWMLRNIWELEDARRAAAQLAIAEERLRISRDLHDLFGRTLATVAVKTELAGELIRRDQRDAALTQLAEVRSIAEQSGQQVRVVVQGYRESDLPTELAGARSLLDAAGIRCVVRGSVPDHLDPRTVSALVWVLRESVTNIIRHAAATECMITIETGDRLRMIITNDGAADLDHDRSTGHGLIGMRERLAAVGGTLVIMNEAGRYTVEVTVTSRARSRA